MFDFTATIICDECGRFRRIHSDTKAALFSKDDMARYAKKDGWTVKENDALCPNCGARVLPGKTGNEE